MTDLDLTARLSKMWDQGESLERLRGAFPDLQLQSFDFRGEQTLIVPVESLLDVLAFLRDDPECDFNYLTDVSAVHWPGRDKPFEVIHQLHSFARNKRLRIKCLLEDEPQVPSAVSIWPTANWLERECYDMFGIRFEDHPDLRRILMPDDFEGWPLRKEFPLKC